MLLWQLYIQLKEEENNKMDQMTLFGKSKKEFINIKEAAIWASQYLNRNITTSNISYLIQYGRIKKYSNNGTSLIKIDDLRTYYDSYDKEKQWKNKLGKDLNWHLSFNEYKESERTKHVHRLHPYKGKFIPQLVEYFLDSHIDEFKKQIYFNKGDIVLDPFCGSGTTLVQSCELGIHAIGIDISAFNSLISNAKIEKNNIPEIKEAAYNITVNLENFQNTTNNVSFEKHLLLELAKFNNKYFPSPEYKRKLIKGEINEEEYSKDKEDKFLKIFYNLVEKYKIQVNQNKDTSFLDKWFSFPVRKEIDFIFKVLKIVENEEIYKILAIILSRTIHSCRATTHIDLGTLKEPVLTTYYCRKHGKICKPIFSIMGWWQRYSLDTLNRLKEFDELRTDSFQICLTGDSKSLDIYEETKKKNPKLAKLLKRQKIKGIFSSPPYVGLIDYHEQHAYSYEIFGFDRKDELEIGPLSKGQGKEARNAYVQGISDSLNNCKKYLEKDYHVFLVANDKFNLYPEIANLANMKIVNQFKRPVLNRVEKDRSNAYSEIIFHFKEK